MGDDDIGDLHRAGLGDSDEDTNLMGLAGLQDDCGTGAANHDADVGQDDDDELAGPGAKECGNCGYTLFIAKGREGKFFSSAFKCPECGAARDQFKDVDMSDV